ncbi:hypothetical protein N7528_005456 [Penicillium herquei]|nr:hypothetical protein N7528_005456 [Penicillium herquei]
MARRGIRRAHTGCVTCKIRRVKCDETQPLCNRCTSTGRKCDGYKQWVPKALKRLQPSIIPGAGEADFRSLDFLTRITAPALAGPLPVSFWVYDILQAAHQEPAVLHAAVAMSTLHEWLKFPTFSQSEDAQRDFALQHYNKAIRCIVASQVSHLDAVVMTCILFNGVEFLRGNISVGLSHYQHGQEIMETYKPSARLTEVFRRFNVFVLLFSHLDDISLIRNPVAPPMDSPFDTLAQAKAALDWLSYRSMKLTLAFYQIQSSSNMSEVPTILASLASKRDRIDQGLDTWSLAAAHFAKMDLNADEKEAYCMLQARWRSCKIFMDMGQPGSVDGRESNEEKFARVLEVISSSTGIDPMRLDRESMGLGFARLMHFSCSNDVKIQDNSFHIKIDR